MLGATLRTEIAVGVRADALALYEPHRTMIRATLAALALVALPCTRALPQELHARVRELLEPHGLARFPPLQRRALDTFVRVEEALARGETTKCAALLGELWRAHPHGSGAWVRSPAHTADLNTGSPPCYYALRMLDDVVAWRARKKERSAVAAPPIALTVVLVGRSTGVEPRSMAELEAGTGHEVTHDLHEALRAGDSRIVHESLDLFGAYVEAITAGRATLRTEIVHLPDLAVRVETRGQPRRHASLAGGALAQVFAAVPGGTAEATDWWWVLYPSHVPERHPDFTRTEFVTGGMATGPDGSSPCFLCDDLWLVRKPPHLGQGVYSDLERRAYLPQWLQHEFFHHLFRTWPEFELEKTSHQWFDRRTWPPGFEGAFEPDYYAEALHRRLQPQARPPLHVALRYAAPPADVVRKLRLADLEGSYVHRPRENDWHEGRIEASSERTDDGRLVLRWRNAARVGWDLRFDRRSARLETGRGNPYGENPISRHFHLVLARDDAGGFLPKVVGFRFGGGLYEREER